MQEGARLRHAGQGNQSSHIVSAVLSFTQRAHMPVTLRNHLGRVLFSVQLYSSITRQQTYNARQQNVDFLEPYLDMSMAFCVISPSATTGYHLSVKQFLALLLLFFLKERREWEWEMRRYQSAAFSHIFQSLQNLCQAGVIRVHKPYRRRGWIRFL